MNTNDLEKLHRVQGSGGEQPEELANAATLIPRGQETEETGLAFSFEDHCALMDAKHPKWRKVGGSATSYTAVAQEFWDAAIASIKLGMGNSSPWQKASEQAPTKSDADEYGKIFVRTKEGRAFTVDWQNYYWHNEGKRLLQDALINWPQWMRIPSLLENILGSGTGTVDDPSVSLSEKESGVAETAVQEKPEWSTNAKGQLLRDGIVVEFYPASTAASVVHPDTKLLK